MSMTDDFTDFISGLQATDVDDFLTPDAEIDTDEAIGEKPYDAPDSSFIQPKRRSAKAREYDKQLRSVMQTGFRVAVEHPATIPDAAAILMHGPKLVTAVSDLAVADARVGAGIDALFGGVENPYLAALSATIPFALQVIRNHEPILEPANRGIKIPFGKGRRVNFRFGIKLGRARSVTNDPDALTNYVFGNEAVWNALVKNGINLGAFDARAKRTAQ